MMHSEDPVMFGTLERILNVQDVIHIVDSSNLIVGDDLRDLYVFFSRSESLETISEQAVNNGIIELNFLSEKIYCNKTLFHNNSNFMFFQNSKKELLYIYLVGFYSGFSIIDVLNKRMVVVFGSHTHLLPCYMSFLNYISKNSSRFLSYIFCNNSSEFKGFLVSNPRCQVPHDYKDAF